ncbi:aldehyde dehydrogenase family protein [Citricoccus sp. NPDC055426]|uniref:aldehyde dehydrogenase family protein n=1 Tax=Citricoccus sp. NPDC055426 TaxID=3155536 RepID=UPI00343CF878
MTQPSSQIPDFIADQTLTPGRLGAGSEPEGDDLDPGAALPVPSGPAVATGTEEAGAAVVRMRQAATLRLAHPRRFRAGQLKGLRRLLEEEAEAICAALAADLGKPATEAMLTEVQPTRAEVDHALLYLTDWMEPQSAKVPLSFRPAAAKIEARPLGSVLVIAPWNYPFMLLMAPLVAAVAAGNTVVLKPSEKAPATSALIGRLIPQYLDPRAVAVVQGGAEAVQALLAERFDHIFYTGGERVGRIVYEAAAKQLTPVTLELGGKSPCVVADGRNWPAIARRIAFGKFTNAGQTCVAPDYVLAVGEESQRQLEKHLPKAIEEFYGADPQQSPDYGRMVNAEHLERTVALLEDALAGAEGRAPARLVHGGRADASDRFLAPTVLADVPADSALMAEEIFGPVLPIIRVDTFEEAVEFITARPHPLAAYLFTDKHRYHRAFEERVTAGGMAFDVALLQVGLTSLPFGGVGPSGMGNYHGRAGFETFSQLRPALTKTDQVDTLRMVYPPYTWAKRQALKRLL